MRNALAGHTNSFHTYSREEALAGIAEAGYRSVELTAVEGWTEHVDLDADTGELRAAPRALRPRAGRALGPFRPHHRGRPGVRHQGGAVVRRLRPPRHEHRHRRPFQPGRGRVAPSWPTSRRLADAGRGGRRRRRARDPRRHHGERRARRCRCWSASATRGSRSPTTRATASSTATSRPSTTSPR